MKSAARRKEEEREDLIGDVFSAIDELIFWLKQNDDDLTTRAGLEEMKLKLDELFPVKNT